MLPNLSTFLYRQVKPFNLLVLFGLLLMFMGVILPWCEQNIDPSGKTGVLDLRFGYSTETAYQVLAQHGESGRQYYLFTEAVVDVFYPITYSLFYALVLSWLLLRTVPDGSRWRMLNIATILAAFFDFFENSGIIGMILTFPNRNPFFAGLASVGGMIKWVFAGVGILSIVVFFVVWLFKKAKPSA